MDIMKMERYLATERYDYCFRIYSLGIAASER